MINADNNDNNIIKYLIYMKEAMENSYIANIAVKLRSRLDTDIIVEVVSDEKLMPVLMMIEANMYTRPALNVKRVSRISNTISVLTNNNETIKIFVYNKEDFNEITLGKLK